MSREDKRPDKAVPLVIYKGGERIIIGQAIVKGDGSIEGQIAKDIRQELKDILFGDRLGAVTLDPMAPPSSNVEHTSTMINATTREPIEVAVVPHLKMPGVTKHDGT